MTRRAIRPEIAQKAVDDIRRRLVVAFFLRLSEVEPCGMSSTFARIFLKLKSIFLYLQCFGRLPSNLMSAKCFPCQVPGEHVQQAHKDQSPSLRRCDLPRWHVWFSTSKTSLPIAWRSRPKIDAAQ